MEIETENDEIIIGQNTLSKRYDQKMKGYKFYKNDSEIGFDEWNLELNKTYSMKILETHPNPILRFIEIRRRKKITRLVRSLPGKVMADVGCESGFISSELKPLCDRLYCIDIDENLLAFCKERVGNTNVDYILSDVQNIRLPDDIIEITVCLEVLEHLPNPILGLKELERITKPDGKIIISVPNDNLRRFFKRLIKKSGLTFLIRRLSEGDPIAHLHKFDEKYLNDIVKETNVFRIEKMFYSKPLFLNLYTVLTPKK